MLDHSVDSASEYDRRIRPVRAAYFDKVLEAETRYQFRYATAMAEYENRVGNAGRCGESAAIPRAIARIYVESIVLADDRREFEIAKSGAHAEYQDKAAALRRELGL